MQPIDIQARHHALDASTSFAVTAPAGSGKTGLLTLRVLKLLPLVSYPEEILCITFTNKAAAEMRERIINALDQAKKLKENNKSPNHIEDTHQRLLMELASSVLATNQKLNWGLLENPTRLRIQTIDGFCRVLSSNIPLDSGLGAESNILTDPEFAYTQAVSDFINQLKQNAWSEKYTILLSHFDNNANRLCELLVKLLGNRDQWLPLIYGSKQDSYQAKQLLQRSILHWRNDLEESLSCIANSFIGECEELLEYAQQNLHEASEKNQTIAIPQNASNRLDRFWKPLSHLLLTESGEFRKALDKRCCFPVGNNEQKSKKKQAQALLKDISNLVQLKELLVSAQFIPKVEYNENQWVIIETLLDVLPLLAAHLKIIFSQIESTDFIEIAQAALAAVQPEFNSDNSVSNLALKLDYQISHILVDEFQDTSLPQLRLLEALVRGWQRDDGRTLFVVGDGMQSCYGFRNANVGIFLDVRNRGLGEVNVKPLELSVNFRSTTKIIDWVNRVFTLAFPAEDNISRGAVKYSPSVAFSNENTSPDSFVQCTWFADQSDRVQEAEYIAGSIKSLQQSHPDESIAVLVRSRSDLKVIIPWLNSEKIRYEAIEIDPLKNKSYIQDLICLTKAIQDTSDRISWLALLRAPWCALDYFDIYQLVDSQTRPTSDLFEKKKPSFIWSVILHHASVEGLSNDAHNILSRFSGVMKISLKQRQQKPLAALIESTWNALGGPCCLNSPSEIQDVNSYFKLLSDFELGGRIADWERFQLNLERLYAQPNTGNTTIQLMTMHKSKGLEFDSVFIPSIDRSPRSEDQALLYWHERINSNHTTDLFLTPISRIDTSTTDPLTQFIKLEKKAKSQLEQIRLFYVACTRAKQRVYLSANIKTDKEGKPKVTSKQSMLGQIWDSVKGEFELYNNQYPSTHIENSEQEASPNLLQRIPLNWSLPTLEDFNWTQESADTDKTEISNKGFNLFAEHKPCAFISNRIERASGTLFHRILKVITQIGWETFDPSQYSDPWCAQLRQLGLTPSDSTHESERIRQCLLPLLKDKQAQWLLNNHHQDSQCEMEIRYGSQPKLIVVDRTFIDSGIRWIIDYKTSIPSQGTSTEDFMNEESKKYASQLKHYTEILSILDQEKGHNLHYKQALYFPYLRYLHPVT